MTLAISTELCVDIVTTTIPSIKATFGSVSPIITKGVANQKVIGTDFKGDTMAMDCFLLENDLI